MRYLNLFAFLGTVLFLSCTFSTKSEPLHIKSKIIPDKKKVINTPPPIPPRKMTPKNELLGKFSPESHPDFQLIESEYTSKTGIYLRKEAYNKFIQMYDSAKYKGVILKIISATRNFDYQKGIFERKWTGKTMVNGKSLPIAFPDPIARAKEILKYSSMPGTSRHHWGTDIDLNNLNNPWFENGPGKEIFDWLKTNGPHFGFYQVYTIKDEQRPFGYEEEKWHWSYLPIAKDLLYDYQKQIVPTDISGFLGSEVVDSLNVIENYVYGINPICK